MPDYGHSLWFAANLDPSTRDPGSVIRLARAAEDAGLDLVTVQDHPYNPALLDAWTLLSQLAAHTDAIRVAGNVHPLPLRPPVGLARAAASLDLLSGGRVELGLGAGGYPDAIAREGGARLAPGAAVDAVEEAVRVIRAIRDGDADGRVWFDGEHYQVRGARPGPRPAHDIGIWVGASGPRMLRLIGRWADGWLPSLPRLSGPQQLDEGNAIIDEAATAAGRSPSDVRRLLNLGEPLPAETVAELALHQGVSGFTLLTSDERVIRWYGQELAPAVRDLVIRGRDPG